MSKPKFELETSEGRNNYVGKVFTLISDNIECLDHWGFYLVNEAFESETDLKNKIGVIWFSSLYDSIEGTERELSAYKDIAEEHGLKNIIKWCDVATEFFDATCELIEQFTMPEQLCIQDYRDSLVHSWLHKRQQSEFHIRYVENKTLIKQRIVREDYFNIVRPFLKGGYQKTYTALRERFSDQKADYWVKAHVLYKLRPIFAKEIYSDIGIDY